MPMIYYLFDKDKSYIGKVSGLVQPDNSTTIALPDNAVKGTFNGTGWDNVVINPSLNDGSPQDKSLSALGLQVATLTAENAKLKQTNQQLNSSLQVVGLQVAGLIEKKGDNKIGSNV